MTGHQYLDVRQPLHLEQLLFGGLGHVAGDQHVKVVDSTDHGQAGLVGFALGQGRVYLQPAHTQGQGFVLFQSVRWYVVLRAEGLHRFCILIALFRRGRDDLGHVGALQ